MSKNRNLKNNKRHDDTENFKKVLNSIDNSTSSDDVSAPDGGWGWVVVAGAVVLNFLIGGAVNTFGVLYVALLDLFQQSSGTTAWVGSMANAMGLLLGPLSSLLSNKFSCRTMVFVGGLITSVGWVASGFVTRLEYMFITYGLIAGIGKSLSYTPSIVMVGQWFDKRRSLANGLSVAGAGVGTFAFAPLLETLLTEYGYKGTMMIMGAVMLHICVCGALFRPVSMKKKIIKDTRNRKVVCRQQEKMENIYSASNIKTSELDVGVHSNSNGLHNAVIIHPNIIENGTSNDLNCAIDPVENGTSNDLDCAIDPVHSPTDPENTEQSTIVTSEPGLEPQLPMKENVKKLLDYTLLKQPMFLGFGISVMLATLGHSPASVMLPSLAKEYGIPSEDSAFLLSIIGIADLIGRLLFGIVSDLKYIRSKRKYVYAASIFISGVANICCTFANSYVLFVAYCIVFGLFAGSYNALTPVILVDMLGVDKLSSSFGLALLFQGIGFLLGPPIAGWLKDGIGNYAASFYFAGAAMIVSSLVINVATLTRALCTLRLRKKYKETGDINQSGNINCGFEIEQQEHQSTEDQTTYL